jgi:hypothetical protein
MWSQLSNYNQEKIHEHLLDLLFDYRRFIEHCTHDARFKTHVYFAHIQVFRKFGDHRIFVNHMNFNKMFENFFKHERIDHLDYLVFHPKLDVYRAIKFLMKFENSHLKLYLLSKLVQRVDFQWSYNDYCMITFFVQNKKNLHTFTKIFNSVRFTFDKECFEMLDTQCIYFLEWAITKDFKQMYITRKDRFSADVVFSYLDMYIQFIKNQKGRLLLPKYYSMWIKIRTMYKNMSKTKID